MYVIVFCGGNILNNLCYFIRYDFIEIRDGTSDNADVLGRHCSNIAPAPIISSGPSLQIRFVSDYAHQGAGFSLRYEIFKTGKGLDVKHDWQFRLRQTECDWFVRIWFLIIIGKTAT